MDCGVKGFLDYDFDSYMNVNFYYLLQWAAAKKSFGLVWRCYQLLSGFLVNGHLPQGSCPSANDKGDNEMILGFVHRSDIYLTGEKNHS